MNPPSRLTAAFLLAVLMLPGCASLIQAPVIALKEARVTGLETSGINIEFRLGVSNPNPFDLSLLGYTYDLQVRGLPLSTGGMQGTTLFPAGTETDMRLPASLKYADLLEIINHAPDTHDIPYVLSSTLRLKGPLGERDIAVQETAVLHIPEQYHPSAILNRLRNTLQGIR